MAAMPAINLCNLCVISFANEKKKVWLRCMSMRALKIPYRDGNTKQNGEFCASGCRSRLFGSFLDENRAWFGLRHKRIERKSAAYAEKEPAERGKDDKPLAMADLWERISSSTTIFTMALFWVFLFFGASAWEGKTTSGKSRRGPRK